MFAVSLGRALRMAAVATCALLSACATQGPSTNNDSTSQNATAKQASDEPASGKQTSGKPVPDKKATPADPAAPTPLHFDWGQSLDAKVFAIREEFTIKGDSEKISRLEAEFRLHAERQDNRYVLTFSELKMKIDDKPIADTAQAAMMGPLSGLVLNYDVAPNGDFVGHHDLGKLQSFTERSYIEQNQKLPPEKRATPQEVQAAAKSSSSPEVLQLEASRTWGALVGMWAGITMTEGKPLGSESSVMIPVVNVPLTVQSKFELVRREECATGERNKACVRLRATSRPDPNQLAVAQRKLKEQMGGPSEPLSMNGLQVEDRYELLTEPGTLRPRWAEWTRGADIEGSEQGSGLLQSRQSVRTRMIFVY